MDIRILENAGTSLARVRTLEAQIADIDSLCGHSITVVGNKNSGDYSDPTPKAMLKLERLREKLLIEKEQAAQDYIAAETELKNIPDEETRRILYWRYIKRYTWNEISAALGPGNTADMLKQRHSRFIRREKRAMLKGVSSGRGGVTAHECV